MLISPHLTYVDANLCQHNSRLPSVNDAGSCPGAVGLIRVQMLINLVELGGFLMRVGDCEEIFVKCYMMLVMMKHPRDLKRVLPNSRCGTEAY